MANYVASNLVAAQAKFIEQFSSPEIRRKQNPALALALKNLSATIPGHQELRKREDRTVYAYLFQKISPGAGTARAARPTGTKGTSIQVGLTWQSIVETFTISMKQGDTNIYSYQEMLMNQMMQAALNIHSRLGTIFLNYLYTNRNQLLTIPYTGATVQGVTPDNINYNYGVAGADSNFFFQKVKNVMGQLNHRGELDIVADPTAFMKAEVLRAQGTQNATNYTFQFDGSNVYQTTEVFDSNNTLGTALAMPAGTFAALPWIPKQNREGYGDYESYTGGYGTFVDPLGMTITELDAQGNRVEVPLTYAIYAYTQASDDQANNGYYQDQVTTFEVSIDVAPTLAPLSGANESVVNEFVQTT
ncbi:MAG: hypothetical protein JST87_05280 [Bacteroidetes bacterium]|nr:hypothetical protein [Bacteroidota bacterium]